MGEPRYRFFGPPYHKVGIAIEFDHNGVFETNSHMYAQVLGRPEHKSIIRREGDPEPAAIAAERQQGRKIVVGSVSTSAMKAPQAPTPPPTSAEAPDIDTIRNAPARQLKDLCQVHGVEYGANREDGEAALIEHFQLE